MLAGCGCGVCAELLWSRARDPAASGSSRGTGCCRRGWRCRRRRARCEAAAPGLGPLSTSVHPKSSSRRRDALRHLVGSRGQVAEDCAVVTRRLRRFERPPPRSGRVVDTSARFDTRSRVMSSTVRADQRHRAPDIAIEDSQRVVDARSPPARARGEPVRQRTCAATAFTIAAPYPAVADDLELTAHGLGHRLDRSMMAGDESGADHRGSTTIASTPTRRRSRRPPHLDA